MVKKKHKKISSWRIAINSLIGIMIFLILQASWDLIHGDISISRIVTFEIAVIVLIAISIHMGVRKIIHILLKQIE